MRTYWRWALAVVIALLVVAGRAAAVQAASAAAISGVVVAENTGKPLVGVRVSARLEHSNRIVDETTDSAGHFRFSDLDPGAYELSIEAAGYSLAKPVRVSAAADAVSEVTIRAARVIAVVVSRSRPGARLSSPYDVQRSAQTQVVLGKHQIQTLSPAAGSGQLLATAPGVQYVSYSATGTAKGMLSVRGFKQGWANNAGVVENGTIGVTLDGVYLNNPQTGIWEANEIPDLTTLEGAVVTYGPGDALNRTFDSLGGTVDFFTLNPSAVPSEHLTVSTGSDNAQTYALRFSTPLSSHWSMLVAQGRTFGDTFRQLYGGGSTPGTGYATLGEFQDRFEKGKLTILTYATNGAAYRPNLIPVTPLANPGQPNQVVTVNGFDANGNPIPGPLYSQKTSGFYSALPANVWQKTTSNSTRVLAADLEYRITPKTTLSNMLWYRHGDRLHVKDFNFDQQDNTQRYEYNNPYSNTVGDKVIFHRLMGRNQLSYGVELLNAVYNTRNAFYNPNPVGPSPGLPTTITNPAKFRNNYFYLNNISALVEDRLVLSKRFDLTPGVRLVSLSTNFVNGGQGGFPDCYSDPVTGACLYNQTKLGDTSTAFNRVEPSLGAHYGFSHDLAGYANYGLTYRNPPTSPGGPYQNVSMSGASPEVGSDVELGVKYLKPLGGQTLDQTPRLAYANLGLFKGRFQNMVIPISQGANEQKVASASGSSNYSGLTFDFRDDVTRRFQVFGEASFTSAFFDTYVSGGTSYSGLPVTMVPKSTAALGMRLEVPLQKDVLALRAWDDFTGPQAMWNNNLGQPDPNGLQIPSYNLVNAALSYERRAGALPYTVTFSVTNLFDLQYNPFEYVTSGAYFGGGDGQGIAIGAGSILADPGPPRMVQLTLSLGR
ncbi:MAG TPA: TonB-dependent receptor [Candidatus Dormibacteraeota bacterium]|nr:TonB-dependent receptor [Candidatus Dormibacteraeota bacterium]